MATTSFRADLRNFLFRSNPVPMFLYDGRSLRILVANDSAIARYGYSRKEFRTMTIRDLLPSGDAPALDNALLHDHEASAQTLRTHSTKRGSLFAVEVQVVPFHSGCRRLSLMSAVGASRWSESRLKLVRSEEINRLLVAECPFGIYRVDLTTSRFERANPALLQALAYTLEELCSINVPDLYVEPADRHRLLSELHTNGSVRDFETRFRKKSGGTVRVSLSGAIFTHAETGRQYVQGYVLDTTRQRELEEQLSRSQRLEAVGHLAGGVAHDFNNITQSISLSCELALQNPLAPAIKSKLLDVMRQTRRAAEITRQLLAFSRLQVLQPRVVNVNDCVREALPMLAQAIGNDVSLELNLDDSVDDVFIDPDQLALVLIQLADNASTAMPHGGELRISTSGSSGNSNPLEGVLADRCTLLTVSDSGIGMDEGTLRHIFEPFFSTKETTLGSGLGLSTVHGTIAQSDGRIECTSSPGKGTTFHIYLPIAANAAAQSTNKSDPFHVLLAEDDPIVNKHLQQALRIAGFSVDAACNGEEAFATFARRNCDILVTDINMPKLGGVELTMLLRRQCPSLPVIFISGGGAEVSPLQHLPPDQICHLHKPFTLAKLITTIHQLLTQENRPGSQFG